MLEVKQLIRSLGYACKGFVHIYHAEQNFRIQIFIGFVVIVFGFILQVSIRDWILLILLITMVLILEILNTVFEKFLDILKPKLHQYVKMIKDMLAMMVLLASFSSMIVGILIFYPYLEAILDY